jgi:hypothetical protein
MIKAGIDAIAHFTMKTTIDQNCISTSTTVTRAGNKSFAGRGRGLDLALPAGC